MLGGMNSTSNCVGSTYNFNFIGSIERMFVCLIGMNIWACIHM